ncbi:MAG: hypothetical protein N0E59_21935, partial [Candidatus Thiodiazotropha taylori]|nr:hypothetical protein [Candidatus Thiodiazotropha taylori]MCW4285783.1 hypothetical protein [Candidatus Thiodiazotropha taylori]
MTKEKILLLFSFITLFVTYSCANEHSAENFINQYIRYTLTQSMTEGFDPRPYYHPDAVLIAG